MALGMANFAMPFLGKPFYLLIKYGGEYEFPHWTYERNLVCPSSSHSVTMQNDPSKHALFLIKYEFRKAEKIC